MTITRTTLLDLPIITSGTETGTWGDITNNGLTQYLDIAVAGMASLTSSDFTAGALTIATTEGDASATNIANSSAQYATIKTSSLAANSTITAPASNRSYRIINADSTYTLTIKASGQTGVTFLPGTTGIVAFNGTDYEIVGVVGAASATDNAIPKFDGTTGQIIQNTGVTIDDSNNVSGVAQLNATTADLTNLEVTNIKAKDGTAAVVLTDSTGAVAVSTPLTANGGVVFNDAGADVDFRVEGDTDANLLFVDASADKVGIGATDPVAKLDVRGILAVSNSVASYWGIDRDDSTGALTFSDGNTTPKLVMDTSGNVGIGTTTPSGYAPFTVAKTAFNVNIGQICAASLSASDAGTAGMSVWKTDATNSASQIFMKFIINNGSNGSGQINADGANQAAFGSYSDRRLKENIVGLEAQLANICALRPVEFDYIKSEGGGHQIGFVAQEMQEVYPDAVGERQPDGMLTITGWSKTEARLVKAIQELKAITDTQAQTISALEARIAALENA